MHIFAFMIVANTFDNLVSFSHGVQMCCWNAPPFHLPDICTWESDILASFSLLLNLQLQYGKCVCCNSCYPVLALLRITDRDEVR